MRSTTANLRKTFAMLMSMVLTPHRLEHAAELQARLMTPCAQLLELCIRGSSLTGSAMLYHGAAAHVLE